jgi:hypothetical protein
MICILIPIVPGTAAATNVDVIEVSCPYHDILKDHVAMELHVLFELLIICCNKGKASHIL